MQLGRSPVTLIACRSEFNSQDSFLLVVDTNMSEPRISHLEQ